MNRAPDLFLGRPQLERLWMTFYSGCIFHLYQRRLPSPTCTDLWLEGVSEYLEDLVARIDALPQLKVPRYNLQVLPTTRIRHPTKLFGSEFHANTSPRGAEGGNMQSSALPPSTLEHVCAHKPQTSTLTRSNYSKRLEMRPSA